MPARVPRADAGTGPGPTVEAEGLLTAGPVAGAPPTAVRRRTSGDRHRAVGTTVAGGPERQIGRRPATMAPRLAAAVADRQTRRAGGPERQIGRRPATMAARLAAAVADRQTRRAGGPERHIGRRPATMAARLAAAVADRQTRPAGLHGPASGPGRATLAGRLVRVTVRTTTAVARPDESVRVPQGAVGRGPLVPPAPAGRTK